MDNESQRVTNTRRPYNTLSICPFFASLVFLYLTTWQPALSTYNLALVALSWYLSTLRILVSTAMFPRLLCLAVRTIAALNAISTTLSVSATPIPLPLPLMAADYSLSLVSVNRTTPRLAGQSFDTLLPERGSLSTRSTNSLASLSGYHDGAVKNSQNLSKRIFF